jgi:hypothetical protein
LNGPETFLRLIDSEEWLWESELYSFAEDDFSTAFDNVVYSFSANALYSRHN